MTENCCSSVRNLRLFDSTRSTNVWGSARPLLRRKIYPPQSLVKFPYRHRAKSEQPNRRVVFWDNKTAVMDLENKVAIVTGAATGLGRAISEELLKHGAKVMICDLDSDAGRSTVEDLQEQYGRRVLFYHCDVTDSIEFEEAFEYTSCMFLNVDIVINNAEIKNDNFWELEVDVNLNGAIRGTLLGQKFMGKQRGNVGGVVVNIGSDVSIKPQSSTPIYTATKHAILGLTKACGDPCHFNIGNVRVFAYCPGPIESSTSYHKRIWLMPYDEAKELDKAVETQKMEHVAKELIPLLKNAPTGSIWLVSGGKPAEEIPYSSI